MGPPDATRRAANLPARISYFLIAAILLLAGWLHLATPLIAAMFTYLALTQLNFLRGRGKWAAVGLFLILVSFLAYGLGYSINQAVASLPEIADKAVPLVIQWAKNYKIELPFTDYDSLKDVALDLVRSQAKYLDSVARFARGATTQFVFLIVGTIVAINIFLDPRVYLDSEKHVGRNNLYSLCCEQIALRFTMLYRSFAAVMGAQLLISAINTVLTGIFVFAVQLPYAVVVIGMTFLCGLLPVVGNLISNTIVVSIGFTVSPRMALLSLIFLVVIHKLEYLLNSKIVGDRIRNPLWLTLLALIVGERLMGIPGMILAPVVLNYVRMETSAIEMPAPAGPRGDQGEAPKAKHQAPEKHQVTSSQRTEV
jgi:predicted PurR-regulated permease PerM